MYKAVISDLDGTLLNSERIVTEFSKDVINKIVSKGIKFYIATGREHPNTQEIMKTIGIKVPLITSNGTRVHDADGNLLYSNCIEQKYLEKIINIDYDKYKDKFFMNAHINDEWVVAQEISDDIKKQLHERNRMPRIIDSKMLLGKDIPKIFYVGEHESLLKLEKEILNKTNCEVNVVFVSPDCLEVFDINATKANAAKFLLSHDGITLEEAVAFGDGYNDYEMLNEVGKGYIMKNAFYRLLEALPNNEIIGTNDEDAEAKKLIELFL